MSVEYRKNRKKWGYRFYLRGICFTRFRWDTKTEARAAERVARTEAEHAPAFHPTALATASGAYLIASAERGRSKYRLDALNYGFKAHILPYFGETTPITDITPKDIENFIMALKRKGLKNSSVKHAIVDLSAMYNWAMESREDGGPGLAERNPVTRKVSRLIGNTRPIKAPINPRWFDIAAAAIENKRDRAWFDVTRYLGTRKDESNRLQWSDIDWQAGKVRIPGTKTDEAEAWMPAAPAALKTLRDLYDSADRDPNSPYIFPGRSAATGGKKIYHRRRMFERIQRVTAIKKYMRQHPEVNLKQATDACKQEGFKGGIWLMPKDLRDYFCTEIAARSNDPAVAMRLMRHTNLATTAKYMRAVPDRMREAVEGLGCGSGCDPVSVKGPEMGDLAKLENLTALSSMLEKYGFLNGKRGSVESHNNVGHMGGENMFSASFHRPLPPALDCSGQNFTIRLGCSIRKCEGYAVAPNCFDFHHSTAPIGIASREDYPPRTSIVSCAGPRRRCKPSVCLSARWACPSRSSTRS
jgi:integrase